MARTNTLWLLIIYKDNEKKEYMKSVECSTLSHIAYLLNRPIYDISNFYHGITKPAGIFKHLTLYKTL